MIIQLCCAKEGDLCEIISLKGDNRNRLAELGFNKNKIVQILKHSKNGPINVKVLESSIALRHSEAEQITVKIIKTY